MPSIADSSKSSSDLTDDEGFSFFLIEPWFMCISVTILLLLIIIACIKMIIDKKEAEIYIQTLGPDVKETPFDKYIKPRLIVVVCSILIGIILFINLITSFIRAMLEDSHKV